MTDVSAVDRDRPRSGDPTAGITSVLGLAKGVGRAVGHARATPETITNVTLTRPDGSVLLDIPVVTTLMARGAFPDSHPQHLGMPGMHGTVPAVTEIGRAHV